METGTTSLLPRSELRAAERCHLTRGVSIRSSLGGVEGEGDFCPLSVPRLSQHFPYPTGQAQKTLLTQ